MRVREPGRICIYKHIYIYIFRERERETERKSERERLRATYGPSKKNIFSNMKS